jgi:hypothetical protein
MRDPADPKAFPPFGIPFLFRGLPSMANLISHRLWNISKTFPISGKSNFHTFLEDRSADLLPSFEVFNDFRHFGVFISHISAVWNHEETVGIKRWKRLLTRYAGEKHEKSLNVRKSIFSRRLQMAAGAEEA